MARMKDKKKANRVTIPGMKGVEGRVLVAESEHRVVVKTVSMEEGASAEYLKWQFSVEGGKQDGASLYYNTSLAPQALWNLRSLLEAMGQDIPDDDTDMDPSDFEGLTLMVSVEHDTYEGKKQAKIVDFWPAEVEDAKKESKGKKASKDDDDDDDVKSKKSRRGKDDDEGDDDKKPAKKSKRDADDDDDDKKPAKKGGKKKSKLTQDEVSEMDEDELRDVVKDLELEVDLDDYRTLRKMRAAVIDACDEGGHFE